MHVPCLYFFPPSVFTDIGDSSGLLSGMDNTTMGEVLSAAMAARAYVHLNAWGGSGFGGGAFPDISRNVGMQGWVESGVGCEGREVNESGVWVVEVLRFCVWVLGFRFAVGEPDDGDQFQHPRHRQIHVPVRIPNPLLLPTHSKNSENP